MPGHGGYFRRAPSTAQIACEVNGAQGRQQQEPTEETLKRSAIAPERSVGILALQGGEDVNTVKIAVVAPTPSAKVMTAVKVNPGFFINIRAP